MANIPLQYPFPYKTTNNTGFTSSVEFNTVTVLGDVTIDQNLTVAGNITTTDLTVGDDLTVGGTIDAQALRAFGIWDSPTATVTGAGAWIGFDTTGHTIFANRKSTAGQTNSFRWYAYDETNTFQGELMRLSNAGNLFITGTRIEFPLIHFYQPTGTYPNYDFILPTSMGGAGQVLTSAGAGNPTYWTTPSGGGGGGGGGTVTNVSAGTMPASMTMTITSPTTTPIINISATTTGSGSFVREQFPIFSTQTSIGAPTAGQGFLQHIAVANANYIQSGLSGASGSSAPLLFTNIGAITEWMRITATGDVGIGTSTPSQKLSVIGSGGFYSATNVGINFSNAAPQSFTIGVRGDTSNVFAITDDTAGAFRMVINTSGAVSIGGTNGTSKLNIGDGTMDSGRYGSVQITQSTAITNSTAIVAAQSFVRMGEYVWGLGYLQNSNNFGFGLGVVSNFSPSTLCLTPTGNVGIGTTAPVYKLTVSGNDDVPSDAAGGFGVLAQSNNNQRLHMGYATTGDYGWIEAVNVGSNIQPLILQPRGANVGIGTTTPSQKLHINNGRLRISDTNDAVIEVFTTSYSNYLYTKASDGHFIFDVSSRNVGIGTTTPSSKLHVNGTTQATNFTTNGTNTFTYEHGTFTPRLMAYRRPTGLAYELGGSLPGPCSITATYSVQTGRYVKIGQNLTINVEIRWTISTAGVGPDDYDIFVWIPDGFNPNAIAVAGPCLNFPNTIGGVSNPMGVLAQYPSFNAGGNVCAIFPTTTTGQIAYPIFAPGGTQILQFAMTYVIN